MLTVEELKAADARDGGGATHKELFDLKSFFVDYLGDLAQGVKLRQRAIATAAVYFRRFYLRQSLREYDPRKLAPACLYLAAKVEECAVQAHDIAAQTRKVCEGERYRQEASPSWHLTVPELLDLELFLVQALEFCLVIFHPYRDAVRYADDMGLGDGVLEEAWLMINDTYRTDLCLLFPPFLIALGVLYTVGTAHQKGHLVAPYLREANTDEAEIKQVCMEMLNFYSQPNTTTCKRALEILAKVRGPPPPAAVA